MIYLDHNATTPLCRPAREAILRQLDNFGNPSSVHRVGREARAVIDGARDTLAGLLGVRSSELIFTGGGTESNNLAVIGLARAHALRGRHLICSSTEHHAVLHAFEYLAKNEGFELTLLPVDHDGFVDPELLRKQLRPDTILVSVMLANNETGVIQPLPEISTVCREHGVLLHSDLVQAFGKIRCDLSLVDAASFAAHKFYGPKGAGLVFLRAGTPIAPTHFGGSHENERRPGTEDVPAIAGMTAAAEMVQGDLEQEQTREHDLRDELERRLGEVSPAACRNGSADSRLSNTCNISFPGVSSETMLMALDLEGVCASSGSACMVGTVVASHVLLAMGLGEERAASAIRFSLGRANTKEEMLTTAEVVERILSRLKKKPALRSYAAV